MHPNAQPLRAVIYTRVSADHSKRARSPEEQEAEIRAVCERNGWTIAEEVLSDNDISASRHSRKDRPAYRRLKELLRPGDVLVTWAASRAQRDLEAYVDLRNLCAERGVLWCYSGKVYDLTDRTDRMATGFQAIIDEDYSDAVREAALRAQRANAREGVAHGKIPYGYRALRNPDTGTIVKRVPHPEQAPIVREIARRMLAGEAMYAIATDLNRRGVPTARAAKQGWTASVISHMIRRPVYAGLRVHKGEVTSVGNWEPLIERQDHDVLAALLGDPTRLTHRGVEPEHLLSGIATCGVCGGRIRRTRSVRKNKAGVVIGDYAQYSCIKFCVKRRQEPVDAMVTEVVLTWCETHSSPDDLADPQAAEALVQARELRARLDKVVARYAAGEISDGTLATLEATLMPQIRAAERRGKVAVDPVVVDLLGAGARARWEGMSMTLRRVVVAALVSVTINKAPPGNTFRPEFLDVKWRH
ncbi:recombinase family protein [Rhodococcus sp. T2V]|uniref:recombinase family protein n=1 Tax=Rhodococcus sp. T2V TaxID=3034164 RepID=UPI0023E1EC5B|nr:recombinase family protein [Rhodococcus sp. T2V]MDF3309806.1 recombinase family protein [Rhodococcus sp. T2V]